MYQGQLMDWEVFPDQLRMAKMRHLASLRWALCSTQIITVHCGWCQVLHAQFLWGLMGLIVWPGQALNKKKHVTSSNLFTWF